MIVASRLLIAVGPLLASLLFGWLVMEGHLNFGSGEKDIFLTVPLLLWSGIFLLSELTLWLQGFAVGRSVAVSGGLATGLTALAWVVLFIFSWLISG